MNSNKFTSYLLYAIGEIVLVVIGILIAVWINQRAAFNMDRQEEVEILKEIRSNLDNDLAEIDNDLWGMKILNDACDFVMTYLKENDQPNREFGQQAFIMRITTHFKKNLSGFELLTSRGIKIIQNDSLRGSISDLFETEYPYYKDYEKERIDFKSRHLDPFLNEYFLYKEDEENEFLGYYVVSQKDYDRLKNEGDYLKLVSSVKRENVLLLDRAKRVKEKIVALSAFLEYELNNVK